MTKAACSWWRAAKGFLTGEANLDMTIKRLVAFAEAGADCLYAPGIRTPEQISAVVKAVAPKPVNVLVMSPDFKVAELADSACAGSASAASSPPRAWGGFMRAAQEIAEKGTFTELKNSYSGRDLAKVLRPTPEVAVQVGRATRGRPAPPRR